MKSKIRLEKTIRFILPALITFALVLPSKQISTNCTVDKCIVCQNPNNLTCTNCAEGYYLKTLSGGDRKYVACWSTTKLVLSMIGTLLFSILACALCYLCYKLGQNNSLQGKSELDQRKENYKDPYYRDPYRDMTPSKMGSKESKQPSPRHRSRSGSPRGRSGSKRYIDRSPRPIQLSSQNNNPIRIEGDRKSVVRRSVGVPRRVIRNGPITRTPGYITPPDDGGNPFRGSTNEYYESRIGRTDPERRRPEGDVRRVDRRYSPDREPPARQIRGYRDTVRDSDIGVVENAEKLPRN